MPEPLAICLEDLDARTEDDRYVQCVALPGNEPGLLLTDRGALLWREGEAACELWVSLDDRLVLWRRADAGTVTVRRGARSLDVPSGKPVILLDQDQVEVGGRRLRIHVHGPAPRVVPPVPLLREFVRAAGRVATAAVIGGTALVGAGCTELPDFLKPLEVRAMPPKPSIPREPDVPDVLFTPDPGRPDPGPPPDPGPVPDARIRDVRSSPPPIEVRPMPPAVAPPQPPPPPPPKPPESSKPLEPTDG